MRKDMILRRNEHEHEHEHEEQDHSDSMSLQSLPLLSPLSTDAASEETQGLLLQQQQQQQHDRDTRRTSVPLESDASATMADIGMNGRSSVMVNRRPVSPNRNAQDDRSNPKTLRHCRSYHRKRTKSTEIPRSSRSFTHLDDALAQDCNNNNNHCNNNNNRCTSYGLFDPPLLSDGRYSDYDRSLPFSIALLSRAVASTTAAAANTASAVFASAASSAVAVAASSASASSSVVSDSRFHDPAHRHLRPTCNDLDCGGRHLHRYEEQDYDGLDDFDCARLLDPDRLCDCSDTRSDTQPFSDAAAAAVDTDRLPDVLLPDTTDDADSASIHSSDNRDRNRRNNTEKDFSRRRPDNNRECRSRTVRTLVAIPFLVFFVLIAVKFAAFLRIKLRSRPAWLYGHKAMKVEHVETCLRNIYDVDPLDPPPLLDSYDDKVYWEWLSYSNSTDGAVPRGQTQQYSTYPLTRAQKRQRKRQRKQILRQHQTLPATDNSNSVRGSADASLAFPHSGKANDDDNDDDDDDYANGYGNDDDDDDDNVSVSRIRLRDRFRRSPTLLPKEPKNVLIAQYTGFGSYAKLLDTVAPVNKAYAKYWGYDYVSLQGTSLLWHGIDNVNATSDTTDAVFDKNSFSSNDDDDDNDDDETEPLNCYFAPGPRATFDKVTLLEAALQKRSSYDYLLILDTDAMIVDFDVDIADLMPSDKALMAQRVWQWDVPHTWDINAGITLWNLHHPTTQTIFSQWKEYSATELTRVLVHNDDQFFLQTILLDLGEEERRLSVSSSKREFYYSKATVVKHFKRETRSWTDTGLDDRLERIEASIDDICLTWPNSCPRSAVPRILYSERPPLQ